MMTVHPLYFMSAEPHTAKPETGDQGSTQLTQHW